MTQIDPELLARLKPPADRPRLKPPEPTPEQRVAIAEARRQWRESAGEDDEDDGMTMEEFNQAVRDI